jgi:DNA end-binding protein Ku
MARAIWSGAISFGLVNAPVRMYSVVHEEDLHFRLLHEKDDGPIGYVKVCKAEDGHPVPDDEIIKVYEVGKDELVPVTDEDFAAAEAQNLRTIAIEDFVPYDQIDPIYFERTYLLGPDTGAEHVYAVLTRAMEDSGLAAIGRYVFHKKEHLGLLRVREGVITLERMYFADEVRDAKGSVDPDDLPSPKAKEVDMARRLIEAYAGDFEPEKYHDAYRERLLELIERKRKGETIEPAPEPEDSGPRDLMEALRASIEAAGGRGGSRAGSGQKGKARRAGPDRSGPKRAASKKDDLDDLSVAELRERAASADVSGRSKMTKAELKKALRAA